MGLFNIMKNITEKHLKILVGIGIVIVWILISTFNAWLIFPLAVWYVAILITKKEGKGRLYRWIVAGILFQPIMSGWGVWRVTGNILRGLLAFLIVFSGKMLIRYLRVSQLYDLNEVYYLGFEFTLGLILTFIILRWAWRRLPDEMKVYGWR